MSVIYQDPPIIPYTYLVGIPNIIDTNVIQASTSGTGLDPLMLLNVPGRAVVQNGQALSIKAFGQTTGLLGTKRLVLDVLTNRIMDFTGLLANGSFLFEAEISRITSSQWIAISKLYPAVEQGTAAAGAVVEEWFFTGGVNWDAPLTLQFSGECANAADTIFMDWARVSVF